MSIWCKSAIKSWFILVIFCFSFSRQSCYSSLVIRTDDEDFFSVIILRDHRIQRKLSLYFNPLYSHIWIWIRSSFLHRHHLKEFWSKNNVGIVFYFVNVIMLFGNEVLHRVLNSFGGTSTQTDVSESLLLLSIKFKYTWCRDYKKRYHKGPPNGSKHGYISPRRSVWCKITVTNCSYRHDNKPNRIWVMIK